MGFFAIFSKKGYILEGMLNSCSFDYLSTGNRFFIMSLFLGGFFTPLVIIIIFYGLLLGLLNSKKKKFNNANENSISWQQSSSKLSLNKTSIKRIKSYDYIPVNLVSHELRYLQSIKYNSVWSLNSFERQQPETVLGEKLHSNKKYLLKREIKVIRSVILCVAFFCITWFPYGIMVLYAQFGSNIEDYITPLSASLPALFAKTSAIYNPIVYTLSNKGCRKFFLKIIQERRFDTSNF